MGFFRDLYDDLGDIKEDIKFIFQDLKEKFNGHQ